MNSSDTHIINKVFIEVNTDSTKQAYYFKDHIDVFIKEQLLPRLSDYFDAIGKKSPSYTIQIEKLDIELSIKSEEKLNALTELMAHKIDRQVDELIKESLYSTEKAANVLLSKEDKQLNEFFQFLETGTSPWWNSSTGHLEIDKEGEYASIIASNTYSEKLLQMLRKPVIRERFIKQFNDEQILILAINIAKVVHRALTSDEIKNLEKIKNHIALGILTSGQLTLDQRLMTWEIVFLKLTGVNEAILRQKLHYLIHSFFEFNTPLSKHLVSNQIAKHIEKKPSLKVLGTLKNEVRLIREKLEKESPSQSNESRHADHAQKKSRDPDEFLSTTRHILPKKESDKIPENKSQLEKESPSKDKESKSIDHSEKETGTQTEYSKGNLQELLNNEDEVHELLPFRDEEIAPEKPSDQYINNAGLILLHPFIKQLFDNCQLLNTNQAINDPELAAHLLHYVATREEQQFEHLMVFEKFLCNIPVTQTINRLVKLPDPLKDHANEMLQAVLGHWPALMNSSADLLRNEFLKRTGKLVLSEDRPRVIIERKTHDILLDKITWNMSMVKFPWKDQFIFVDW